MTAPFLIHLASVLPSILLLLLFCSLPQSNARLDPSTSSTHSLPHPDGDWQVVIRHWKGSIAAIHPNLSDPFSFASDDEAGNFSTQPRHHSLTDLTLQLRREDDAAWQRFSTVDANQPALLISAASDSLPAFDVTPLLHAGHGLRVTKTFSLSPIHSLNSPSSTALTLTVRISNNASDGSAVSLGHVGLTASFSTNWNDRDLDAAAAYCSLAEPFVSGQHSWVKVTRLTGAGRVLLLTATEAGRAGGRGGSSGMSAWRQLKDEDSTPTGYAFEGHYEWTAVSAAWQQRWQQPQPWVDWAAEGGSIRLQPQQSVAFSWSFQMLPSVRQLSQSLAAQGNASVISIPGYLLSQQMTAARLFLSSPPAVSPHRISFNSTGSGRLHFTVSANQSLGSHYHSFDIHVLQPGRVRVTISIPNLSPLYVNYLILPPLYRHLQSVGSFSAANQWITADDPFGRAFSVMPYDFEAKSIIYQDDRSYVVGLSDEAGAGPGLALTMKNRYLPSAAEVMSVDLYINRTLWGSKGPDKFTPYATSVQNTNYSVRASMFWYPGMPKYQYTVTGGWDADRASQLWRSYNYVHPTVTYHSMYRLCRDYDLLTPRLYPCLWYLSQANQTFQAMFTNAPYYTQFGLMEGSVFLDLMTDLLYENLTAEYEAVSALQLQRAQVWDGLQFPFGSEMPWDSTGQEEIWLSAQRFGLYALSNRSLSAILAYSHSVPNWAYHGSARRFWDFWINGKPNYTQPWPERNLHHYGSSLNGKPLLRAYEIQPDDWYVLEVGVGSMTGVLSNIQPGGATSMGFHADNALLRHDPFDADYGCALYGHVTSASSYFVLHPDFGPLCYLCNLITADNATHLYIVEPVDSLQRRIYLEPIGSSVELEVGRLLRVGLDMRNKSVLLHISGNDGIFSRHRLRVQHWARCEAREGCGIRVIKPAVTEDRGAWTFVASDDEAQVLLSWADAEVQHTAIE